MDNIHLKQEVERLKREKVVLQEENKTLKAQIHDLEQELTTYDGCDPRMICM